MEAAFGEVLPLKAKTAAVAHRLLADKRIAGGAVYDGLVALAAQEHHLALATRDERARPTYAALGVTVVIVR
jgi:predicted nucleic acid-binding protein